MTFKEKLVKLRKLKGLTQDEFASAVGVSRQAVYKWESGQSYPEVSKLIEIKLLFGISIDDLLDESYEVIVPEKKRKRRISTETKKKIEEEVKIEEAAKATEESAPTEEKVAETVEEAAPVEENVEEAPAEEKVEETVYATTEAAVVEETAPLKEEAAPVEGVSAPQEEAATEEATPEKRRGFFAKLFGKK